MRCSICKIKVGFDYFECSCDPSKIFCKNHRFPFTHNCNRDCKKEQIDKLLEIKWWDWNDEKINDYTSLLCNDNIDDFILS
mgnify:CR=1 FL=1